MRPAPTTASTRWLDRIAEQLPSVRMIIVLCDPSSGRGPTTSTSWPGATRSCRSPTPSTPSRRAWPASRTHPRRRHQGRPTLAPALLPGAANTRSRSPPCTPVPGRPAGRGRQRGALRPTARGHERRSTSRGGRWTTASSTPRNANRKSELEPEIRERLADVLRFRATNGCTRCWGGSCHGPPPRRLPPTGPGCGRGAERSAGHATSRPPCCAQPPARPPRTVGPMTTDAGRMPERLGKLVRAVLTCRRPFRARRLGRSGHRRCSLPGRDPVAGGRRRALESGRPGRRSILGAAALGLLAMRSMELFILVVLVLRPAVDGLHKSEGWTITDPSTALAAGVHHGIGGLGGPTSPGGERHPRSWAGLAPDQAPARRTAWPGAG